MKLLVFAHTPPPHHGQSYMVQRMLEGFGGDCRVPHGESNPAKDYGVECYHVNARFSSTLTDIGGFQLKKVVLLLGYCAHAVWCRFRYGIPNFYYVPAPGQRAPLYRDWLVMLLCRPFFERVILHWHAAGMPGWVETSMSTLAGTLTLHLLGHPDLSIVLSHYNRIDAEKILSKKAKIVGNGIPDPCPQFQQEVLPNRLARCATRRAILSGASIEPHLAKVLYLAHCMREKGLFDVLDAIALTNRKLFKTNSALRLHLTVAGEFFNPVERQEFDKRLENPDLQLPSSYRHALSAPEDAKDSSGTLAAVRYIGFVSGPEKAQAFAESDLFCFPSFYHAESFGLVLVEAMAFGLPIVTTRWRSLPELFPPDYPGLVDIKSPDQIAEAFVAVMASQTGEELRESFVNKFTLQTFLAEMANALRSVEPA
jgi:glycosyltransferase involved in cell wall biosynthesis